MPFEEGAAKLAGFLGACNANASPPKPKSAHSARNLPNRPYHPGQSGNPNRLPLATHHADENEKKQAAMAIFSSSSIFEFFLLPVYSSFFFCRYIRVFFFCRYIYESAKFNQ
jgi:hypothetical protein